MRITRLCLIQIRYQASEWRVCCKGSTVGLILSMVQKLMQSYSTTDTIILSNLVWACVELTIGLLIPYPLWRQRLMCLTREWMYRWLEWLSNSLQQDFSFNSLIDAQDWLTFIIRVLVNCLRCYHEESKRLSWALERWGCGGVLRWYSP